LAIGCWRLYVVRYNFCRVQYRQLHQTQTPVSSGKQAERTLTAVMAVPHPGLWEKSAASIGSNGSTPSGDFSEIEATIHRLCDARSDDDGQPGGAAGSVLI
jgi:hypothetical protein